jgi:hypothetical protein
VKSLQLGLMDPRQPTFYLSLFLLPTKKIKQQIIRSSHPHLAQLYYLMSKQQKINYHYPVMLFNLPVIES